MSLHYLIDGYNVVKQSSPWQDMPLDKARASFLKAVQGAGISPRNKITVVFDGKEDVFSLARYNDNCAGIQTIFSSGQTADDLILKILNHSPNPKDVVVVSDDRALRLSARSTGAGLKSVREFISGFNRCRENSNINCAKLSVSEEKQITDELKKIWLKEK